MISVTVEVLAQADVARAFDRIVPIDLASIFTGFGPLPAVTGTSGQTGAWDAPGRTRTVLLSDGSSVQERLIRCERPCHFVYVVHGFTGMLGRLASSASGEWWFRREGPERTRIAWRYTFHPASVLAIPILWLITNGLWCLYMRRALRRSRRAAEAP